MLQHVFELLENFTNYLGPAVNAKISFYENCFHIWQELKLIWPIKIMNYKHLKQFESFLKFLEYLGDLIFSLKTKI